MSPLAEVYGNADERRSRRLYLAMALALVLAGSIVFAAGATRVLSVALAAAGFDSPLAERVAALAGALLPPALLLSVLVIVGTDRVARLLAALGAVLAVWGTIGFFLFASGGGREFAVVAVVYAVGVTFVLAGVGRAVAGPISSRPADAATPDRPAESATAIADGRGGFTTDGGESDDGITSLLEE